MFQKSEKRDVVDGRLASRAQIIHGDPWESGGKNPGPVIGGRCVTLAEFCLALSKSLKLCSGDTSHRAVIRPLYLAEMPSAARLGIGGQTDGPIKPEARDPVRTLRPRPGKPRAEDPGNVLIPALGGASWLGGGGVFVEQRGPLGSRRLRKSEGTVQGGGLAGTQVISLAKVKFKSEELPVP